MAVCESCGADYHRPIEVSVDGGETHTYDSFECAIHALAPSCASCGVRVIGHGTESGGQIYCCGHCASA